MFYDLNLTYDRNNSGNNKELLNAAATLGYNVVAWNYTVKGKTTSADVGAVQKLKFEGDQAATKPAGSNVKQMTRLTLVLEDNAQQMLLTANNPLLLSYDLVAVQPGTEALLLKCCQSSDIDIISFDLSQRLPFNLKPAILSQAFDHGLFFEVCLSHSFKDALARRIFISNVTQLVKVTRGKNVLFTTGAATALNSRAPYDFINLASIFGIEAAAAKRSLTQNARSTVLHAHTRKTQKGVMDIVDISDLPEEDKWKVPEEPGGLMVQEDVQMDVDEPPKQPQKPSSSSQTPNQKKKHQK